jgi:hypothetical protein
MIKSSTDQRLQKRVNAWFQRCRNPNDKSYHNYGGRGIECRFASVREGVDYIKAQLPHPDYLKLDIDRRTTTVTTSLETCAWLRARRTSPTGAGSSSYV